MLFVLRQEMRNFFAPAFANELHPSPGPFHHFNQAQPTPGPSHRFTQLQPTPEPSHQNHQLQPTPGPSHHFNQFQPTPGPSHQNNQPTPTPGPSRKGNQPTLHQNQEAAGPSRHSNHDTELPGPVDLANPYAMMQDVMRGFFAQLVVANNAAVAAFTNTLNNQLVLPAADGPQAEAPFFEVAGAFGPLAQGGLLDIAAALGQEDDEGIALDPEEEPGFPDAAPGPVNEPENLDLQQQQQPGNNDEEGIQQIHECAICFVNAVNAAAVPCGHTNFCVPCIREQLHQNNATCPICRTPLISFLTLYF